MDCSNKVLRKSNFKLKDERGRQVPLNEVSTSTRTNMQNFNGFFLLVKKYVVN